MDCLHLRLESFSNDPRVVHFDRQLRDEWKGMLDSFLLHPRTVPSAGVVDLRLLLWVDL